MPVPSEGRGEKKKIGSAVLIERKTKEEKEQKSLLIST